MNIKIETFEKHIKMRLQKYVPSFDTQSITEMQHELAPGTFLKLSSVLSLSYGSIFITLSNSGYSYQDIIYLKPLSFNLNPWNITVICLLIPTCDQNTSNIKMVCRLIRSQGTLVTLICLFMVFHIGGINLSNNTVHHL